MRIGQAPGVPLLASVVVLCTNALAACGGRASVDGDPANSAAAGQSSAGSTSAVGGASGVAGVSSAGGALGTAGESAAGSAGVRDCAGVTCAINCSTDEFVQWTPSSCCGQCKPQTPECLKGRAGYLQLVTTLTHQSDATSCVNDDDCTLLPNYPDCGDACRGRTVSITSAPEITTELSQWEAANCSTCMATTIPCPASPPPVCVAGTCLSYYLL